MDAIRCKEWRIFPGLSLLGDYWGFVIFMFAHLPIFFFIYHQLNNPESSEAFMKGFTIFLIAHLLLHILYLKHSKNAFKDWISWTFIAGSAVFVLIDVLV